MIYCDCDSQEDPRFPLLAFQVGKNVQHWFFMKGRDYLLFSQSMQKCALLIKAESSSIERMWLMGDPFLRAYYSIHDMEK